MSDTKKTGTVKVPFSIPFYKGTTDEELIDIFKDAGCDAATRMGGQLTGNAEVEREGTVTINGKEVDLSQINLGVVAYEIEETMSYTNALATLLGQFDSEVWDHSTFRVTDQAVIEECGQPISQENSFVARMESIDGQRSKVVAIHVNPGRDNEILEIEETQ